MMAIRREYLVLNVLKQQMAEFVFRSNQAVYRRVSRILGRNIYSLKLHNNLDEAPEAGAQLYVVIPTTGRRASIFDAIDSVTSQTISYVNIHIVVVGNGPDASKIEISEQRQGIDFTYLSRVEPNAAAARNLALDFVNTHNQTIKSDLGSQLRTGAPKKEQLRGCFVTFLDDDDVLEPRVFEALFSMISKADVVCVPIVSQHEHYEASSTVRLSPYWAEAKHIGVTTGRIFPLSLLESIQFNEKLDSGEDVVFSCNLLTRKEKLKLAIVDFPDAAYRRGLSPESITRGGQDDFDFSFTDRFAVIDALFTLELGWFGRWARLMKVQAQLDVAQDFLERHPEAMSQARRELERPRKHKFAALASAYLRLR